jgi:hypothetical protein
MKKSKINVKKPARNCVGVRATHPVTTDPKICTGRDAAKALAKVKLSPNEAKAWCRELKAARQRLRPPTNNWD